MNTVRTEKELATQIENNADMIIIEGSLKDKVIRIKAVGKAAWIVAIGAIGVIAFINRITAMNLLCLEHFVIIG